MNHSDHVALIRDGVEAAHGRWADLGAGAGAFTLALADLLGPGASITAVDRDRRTLQELAAAVARNFPDTRLDVLEADFRRPLPLADLDGVVMANSLHFVRDKAPVVAAVASLLRPGGRLVVVEYGADRGNPWVPHPFSYAGWEKMAREAGLVGTRLLATVPSRFLGSIYAAVSMVDEPPRR